MGKEEKNNESRNRRERIKKGEREKEVHQIRKVRREEKKVVN